MKAKQKKIRVFDIFIDDENSFFDFINKNFILIKDYLLLIEGEVTPKIQEYLKENGFCFVISNGCNIKKIDSGSGKKSVTKQSNTQKSSPEKETKVLIKEQIITQPANSKKTKVINKPVRSGEVIEYDGDVVVFSRVNSGAKVISEGNVSVLETVDGIVEANGDYMILKSIGKGYVVFNGDILDKENFSDQKTKKIVKTHDGFKIEEL